MGVRRCMFIPKVFNISSRQLFLSTSKDTKTRKDILCQHPFQKHLYRQKQRQGEMC